MSDDVTPQDDPQGKPDIDEAAEEGPLDPPVGTSGEFTGERKEGDSYEERQEEEGGGA